MNTAENRKKLLIVAHTPSDNLRKLLTAVTQGAASSDLSSTDIHSVQALEASPDEVLTSDAIILITSENLGYMSGGMKDFFDRIYYPCLEEKQGLPVAAIIRAGHDGTGTRRALETITTGLRWRWVQEPLTCRGEWRDDFTNQASELGEAMAIAVDQGII